MRAPEIMIHAPSAVSREAGGPSSWATLGKLQWKQPKRFHRHWILTAGQETLAEMSGPGLLGSTAVATTPATAWTIVLRWVRHADIMRTGDTIPAIRYAPGWRGGTLKRAPGPLKWKRTSFWRHHYEVQTDEAFPVLRLRTTSTLIRQEAEVEFDTAARALEDLEALTILSWALALQDLRAASE